MITAIFTRKLKLVGCMVLLAVLFGCSANTKPQAVLQETKSAAKLTARVANTAMGFDSAAPEKEMAYAADAVAEESIEQEAGSATGKTQERKLIKTGSIQLEVENLATAEQALEEWCSSFNGYISSSYNQENLSSFTVRIPSTDFDVAMNALGNLGKLKSRSISTQDVSEQYYDLQTRLETRKILKERLQTYLSNAKDMKDMLQIESELNNTLSEIESMEGRMRRLSNQIDFSTITVTMDLPYRTTDQGFQWPSVGNGLRHFASNILDFFAGFVTVLMYIVICGIPVLAAIAFFYWLLLGKVGLLKKIFRKLSEKK